jgi:hypothetical protein
LTSARTGERLAPHTNGTSTVDDWEQLEVADRLVEPISPLCFANLTEVNLAGSRRISHALIEALGSSVPGAIRYN